MEQRLEVERFREPKGGNSRKARNRRQGPKRRRLERALRTAPTPHPHSLTEGVSVNQAERVPPGESQEGCFSRSERQAPRQGSTTEKRSRPRGDARILRRICRTTRPSQGEPGERQEVDGVGGITASTQATAQRPGCPTCAPSTDGPTSVVPVGPARSGVVHRKERLEPDSSNAVGGANGTKAKAAVTRYGYGRVEFFEGCEPRHGKRCAVSARERTRGQLLARVGAGRHRAT